MSALTETYRKLFLEAYEEESTLTDEAISAIIKNVDGDGDDAEEGRVEKMKEAQDTKDQTPAVNAAAAADGDENMRFAIEQASKGTDKDYQKATNSLIDAFEKTKAGPVAHLMNLRKAHNVKSLMELGWPRPGSKPVVGSNQRHDIFTKSVRGTDGLSFVETTFVKELASADPIAIAAKAKADHYRTMGKDNKDNPEGLLPTQVNAKVRYWDNRIGVLRTLYRRAIEIEYQLADINAMPRCKASFIYEVDDKGEETTKIVNSPRPLKVWGTTADGGSTEAAPKGIGAFLAMKPDLALKAGGTIAALLATSKRKPKSGTGETEQVVKVEVKDVNQSVTYLQALAHYFDNGTDDGEKHISALNKLLAGNNSDDLVETVGNACMALDAVWTNIKDRYNRLTNQRAAVKEAEAASKRAKAA